MRVVPPDWRYQTHGPFLVTAYDWRNDQHASTPAETLLQALMIGIPTMSRRRDLAHIIVDGRGCQIFGRSADSSPFDFTFFIGTRQVYDVWLELAASTGDIALEIVTMELFTMIAEWMGVQLT